MTEGDKVEAEIRFGMSVNTWGMNDLVEVVSAVPDEAAYRGAPLGIGGREGPARLVFTAAPAGGVVVG